MHTFQRPVVSVPSRDFREALLTNEASETVNLVLPTRDVAWYIRAISLVSLQNLAWEIQAYTSAENLGGTFETDRFLASWQFTPMVAGPPASPGWPVEVVGMSPADPFYHAYIEGNVWPYIDLDQAKNANLGSGGTYPANAHLHVRLINRSSDAKLAGDAGAVQVTFFVEPQGRQSA